MNLSELQKEHSEWQKRNFPEAEPWECLVGMQEELGELTIAMRIGDRENLRDALGDIAIYLIGFCTLNDMSIERDCIGPNYLSDLNIEIDSAWEGQNRLQIALGSMCHAYLKRHQGIRNSENHALQSHVSKIFTLLARMAVSVDAQFETVLENTWDVVNQRDWVAERESDE